MRSWWGAVCLLLCCCSATWAQVAKTTISGFVYDRTDGEALIGASIYLRDLQLGAISNSSGYYVITEVEIGRRELSASFIGYQTAVEDVFIEAGKNTKIDLYLSPQTLQTEETVVHADSARTADKLFAKTISSVNLAPRQINQIPQVAEADLLRSLQALPGILPLSDFSSALYVRGGTPDQNLYMVDGADVYNPEHAFGIFSTFNTDAIKQVELSKGGFGAEYGGRLSSVLDVTNLDGNREQFTGTASISLLSTKSTLQMPLGERGSLSGSLRRTYFDQTVGRRLDDIPDYYFYDGNIKVFLDLGDSDKLMLSYFGGRDFLDVTFDGPSADDTGFAADWGNKTGSLRYTRVFSPQIFGNFWLTGSRFTSDFEFEEAEVEERNLVTDMTLKGNLEYHHAQSLRFEFGAELKRLHVRFRQRFSAGVFDPRERPDHYALYGVANWRPGAGIWDIEAGLRYNHFAASRTFADVDPRLALKYRLSDTATLKLATGIYHQYLHSIPRFIATDIWTTSNRNQDPSRAIHYVAGFQQEWARNWQFEVETYYKSYDHIYEFNENFLTQLEEAGFDERNKPIISSTRGLFNSGNGHSLGIEVLLRKDAGAVNGWLGYSLARTRYTMDAINGARAFSPRHDRTSTLNLVANVDLRNALRKMRSQAKKRDRGSWLFGANLVYSTGQPITEPGSAYISRLAPSDPELSVNFAPTRINGVRLPPYARLDLSLKYERDFGSWKMVPYLQIFNVGNRRNVWFVDYDFSNNQPEVDAVSMFPLLPTVGINFEF